MPLFRLTKFCHQRAKKFIESPSKLKKNRANDPKRFIEQGHCTPDGEVASKTITSLVHIKDPETKKYTFKYQTPKTKNSIRKVPMQESVYRALRHQSIQLKEMQMACSTWEPIFGFENLVFVGKNGKPVTEHTFQVALNWIENSINKERMAVAEETNTPYTPISHFYPHALRHTFATRCFEAGIDAKVVQGYLGHYSISITLDLYTHVTNDKAKTEMDKLEELYQAIV